MKSFTKTSIVLIFLTGIAIFANGQTNFDNDIGIQSILEPQSGLVYSDEEPVTIRINNWGNNPQSNFDVSFSLNGADTIIETIDTVINPFSFIDFTFTETLDLSSFTSILIESCTYLTNDENPDNDCKIIVIQYMQPLPPPQNLVSEIIGGNDLHLSWDPPEGYNNWLFWDD